MTQKASRTVTVLLVTSIAAMVAALLVVGAGGSGWTATIGASLAVAIGLLIVILMVSAAAARSRRRRQQEAIQRVIEQVGLQHQPRSQVALHRELAPLPGIPRSGACSHVLTGEIGGRRLVGFQHLYMVHTGQASFPVHHTVYTTSAPEWPSVTIRPRGSVWRLLRRFGRGQGLLLDDPAFNDAFKVVTNDEDFAVVLLHPEMQRFMLTHRGTSWQVGAGKVAVVYRGQLRFEQVDESVERLRTFWRLVPPELEAW